MSLMSHKARGLAKALTAALVVFAGTAGATGAQAAVPNVPDVTLDFTCKYPIVDKQPLSIKISSNIPSEVVVGVKQPEFEIDATAVAKGDTARAINTLNAYSIVGFADAFADLEFPDGFIQEDLFVPLTVAPWNRPSSAPVAGDLTLSAKGRTPSIQLEPVGTATIRLDRIALTLQAKGASGNTINVRKLTTDFDGNPVPADTTPDDFNVYCKLNAGQSNVIATIKVVPEVIVGPHVPKVTGLKATAKSPTTVALAWDAATDPDAGDSIKEYRVYQGATLVKTVAAPATSADIDVLTPDTDYLFTVVAVDTKGPLEGPPSDALAVKTDPAQPTCMTDTKAPTTPTPGVYLPDGSDAGENTLNVRWGASTDPADGDCPVSGLDYYRVATDEAPAVEVPAGTLSQFFGGLAADSEYYFWISAVDKAGNRSEESGELLVTKPALDLPPTKVSGLKGLAGTTSIALSWSPATDPDAGDAIKEYRVYQGAGATPVVTVTGLSATVSGLTPNTAYRFSVAAVDTRGYVEGPKSEELAVTTLTPGPTCPEGLACQGYTLAGSTTLKTLTKGVLPLKGGIDAALDPSNGKFSADLVLSPTSGRLTAGGFLPVTVKISFAPSGKTTGTLDDANILRSKSLVRIKVSEVKLFGAIPLAGGNSCQTKSLSEINLTSTKAFEIFKGGTLTGTYAISDLNGCGVLNGIVSPLTAGKGNTISLDLSPVGGMSPPLKVTGLKAGPSSTTSVDLSWTAPVVSDPADFVKEYRVYQDGDTAPVRTVSGTETSAKVVGLSPATEYSFTVEALGANGLAGPRSQPLAVKTATLVLNTPPTIPTGLQVDRATSSTVALSWAPSTDDVRVAGYTIYRDGVKVGTSPTPTFSTVGLAPSTAYAFEVEAFDDAGATSPRSAAVAVRTLSASACSRASLCQEDVTLEYTCKYPIVDKQPLSVRVSSNIPRQALLRVNQPAFQINAVATAKGDTARAINTLNAYSIEGSSEAFADLEFPDGFIQEDLFVPLVVEPWIRPSSDPVTGNLVLTAKGDTPSVQLEPVGNALIRLDRITLNLVAKGQSGNIINVRKLTSDFFGNPVPADTTPNDFNVYCELNQGQSNLIATIQVVQ